MTMPEPGFKSITVPDRLYRILKREAKKRNKSIASYIEELLGLSLRKGGSGAWQPRPQASPCRKGAEVAAVKEEGKAC